MRPLWTAGRNTSNVVLARACAPCQACAPTARFLERKETHLTSAPAHHYLIILNLKNSHNFASPLHSCQDPSCISAPRLACLMFCIPRITPTLYTVSSEMPRHHAFFHLKVPRRRTLLIIIMSSIRIHRSTHHIAPSLRRHAHLIILLPQWRRETIIPMSRLRRWQEIDDEAPDVEDIDEGDGPFDDGSAVVVSLV